MTKVIGNKLSIWRGLVFGVLLMGIGSGCRLGPNYEPPGVGVPNEWKNGPQENDCDPLEDNIAPVCIDHWWEVFGDDVLSELEDAALANSPNLKLAFAKIVEARAVVEINRSALFPQITTNPSYYDAGQLFKLYLPQGVFPFPKPNFSVFRIHQYQYVLPLNLNYELDLWGKLRGQYESAVYAAQAQDEDYLNVLLTLTTDVANNYFQLRLLDTQIAVLEETIENRKKNLSISQSRNTKGLSNALDVAGAELEVSNAESSYYDAMRQRGLIENMIAVLIGMPPSTFCLAPAPLADLPPSIPAGIPSIVLLQRPDVAEAERKCAAEHAQIGVAYASLFPSLSLTGTLGYSSPDLSQFLKWISRLWTMGLNIGQTVFDGGFNEGNIIEALASFSEASYAYQKQVLIAFQDVENALNNLEFQAKQYESLSESVGAADKRYRLSSQRYQRGLSTYLEVTDSEENVLTAQLSLANLQGQRFISTVQLIKALGGSWESNKMDTGYSYKASQD